jgi:hypothetical protein
MLEIGRAEIGFTVAEILLSAASPQDDGIADDFWKLWNSGLLQKSFQGRSSSTCSTWSEEEMAYEEKILLDIVREDGRRAGGRVDPELV